MTKLYFKNKTCTQIYVSPFIQSKKLCETKPYVPFHIFFKFLRFEPIKRGAKKLFLYKPQDEAP